MKEKRKDMDPLVRCSWFSLTEDVLTTSKVETGAYNMSWFADEWN